MRSGRGGRLDLADPLERAANRLVALVGSLSDDEVAARPDYFEDLGSHYRDHLRELT